MKSPPKRGKVIRNVAIKQATRQPYAVRPVSSNLFRCSATTSLGASRFFGLDAIEWSVTLTGSVLIAFAAWMM
jgi:hypothetical protein